MEKNAYLPQLNNTMLKKKYVSSKLAGTTVRSILWDTDFFSGENTRVDYSKAKKGDSRRDSLLRARFAVFDIVECNTGQYSENPTFVTLTFKDNVESLRYANSQFKSFIYALRYRLGFPPIYIAVPEFQKRGAVHFHILFFNLPFIFVSHEVKEKIKKKSIFNFTWSDIWLHGDVNVKTNIRNNYTHPKTGKIIKTGFASYMAKYLSKEYSDSRLYSQKKYFTSRNILRPIKFFGKVDVDTIVEIHNIHTSLLGIDKTTTLDYYSSSGDFQILEGHVNIQNTDLLRKLSGRKLSVTNK